MTDEARLGLNVDASSVDKANASLGTFEQHAHNSATGAREMQDGISRLTREMETMIRLQERGNQLLEAGINAQRATGVEVENNTRRMTELAVGVTAAAGAYELFSRRSTEATRTVTDNIAQMSRSIDGLQQRLTALSAASGGGGLEGLMGAAASVNNAANAATLGLLMNRIAVAGPVTPAQLGPPQLDPMTYAAIYQNIAQMASRYGTQPGTLLQGANTGNVLGIGGDAGAQLNVSMQRNLEGMGQGALIARRTLDEFGISTRDANLATREFLSALNDVRDDMRRTAIFQQVFPGADPGMLTRTSLTGLNAPEGSIGQAQQQRADFVARVSGYNATLEDQVNASERTRTRQFFGMLPANVAPRNLFSFGSPEYQGTEQNINLQERKVFEDLNHGTISLTEAIRQEFPIIGADFRNFASALTGGLIAPPEAQAPTADQRRSAPITEEERQSLYTYEARLGRQSPAAISARLQQERQRSAPLVERGLLSPEQQTQDLKMLAERFERAADPIGRMIEKLGEEAALAGATPAQRQNAQAIFQASDLARLYGQAGGLNPSQSTLVTSQVEARRVSAGGELMRQLNDEIEQTKKLSAAYAEGGGAVTRLNAEYQAQQDVIKGVISASQEADVALKLMTKSFSSMVEAAEKEVNLGRERSRQSGVEAAAAVGGPPALRRQQVIDRVQGQYTPQIQEALSAGDTTNAQKLQDLQQQQIENELKIEQNRAQEQNTLHDRTFNRNMQSLGRMSIRSGADVSTGAEPVLADAFDHAAANLPPGYNMVITSGARAHGSRSSIGMGSSHVGGRAIDREIVGPNGVLPPTGEDTTGLYNQTFRDAQAYLRQSNPEMARFFRDGATFGANRRGPIGPDNPPDIGHADVRGYSGTVVTVPPGSTATVTAGASGTGGTSEILRERARRTATAELEAQGVTQPSQAQIEQRARQNLATQAQTEIENTQLRNRESEATVDAQRRRAAAELEGTRAVQDAEDAIKVETQMRRESATALASGFTITTEAAKREAEALTALTASTREAERQGAANRVLRQFSDQQGATSRETAALESGGRSAFEQQRAAEPFRAQLMATGNFTPGQADELSKQMAAAATQAKDYQGALLDASKTLKDDMSGAIDKIVNGLESGIGKAHGLRNALMQAALDISKIGVNTFVKKPLNTLLDNLTSGKGFSFEKGNSGISDTDALLKVAGKALGIGGDSKSDNSSDSGGFFSKLLGGNSSMLGRLFGGGSKGSGSDNAGYSGEVTAPTDYTGDFGDWSAASYHSGGRVKRLHSGGFGDSLASDEVPAILQTGERVLSRSETSVYDQIFPAGIKDVLGRAGDDISSAASSIATAASAGARDLGMAGIGQFNEALSGAMANQPFGSLRTLGTLAGPMGANGMASMVAGGTGAIGDAAFYSLAGAGTLSNGARYGEAAGIMGGAGLGSTPAFDMDSGQGYSYDPIGGGFTDAGGGTFYHSGGLVRRMHSGGMVGPTVPRFHSGGVSVNREPAPAGGGGNIQVTQHIHTQDADSFRRSSRQIASETSRSLGIAQRNM